MAVRSRIFGLGSAAAAGPALAVYVCPPGRTALVKQISGTNASGTTSNHVWRVRRGSVSAQIARLNNLAHLESYGVQLDSAVLEPGDVLELLVSVTGNGAHHWYAAGSLLLGEPV